MFLEILDHMTSELSEKFCEEVYPGIDHEQYNWLELTEDTPEEFKQKLNKWMEPVLKRRQFIKHMRETRLRNLWRRYGPQLTLNDIPRSIASPDQK